MKPYEETRFGDFLRKYRIRNNLSQSALARAVGVSPNTVHLWETRRCRPEIGSLQRLSEITGESLQNILELVE